MNKPYTKDQLVDALTTFASANKKMRDVMSQVEPTIESTIEDSVKKALIKIFDPYGKGKHFSLVQAVPIISPLFSSFIELYFVDELKLKAITKNDLTKDEISEGQWDLIRSYRKGETTAESLYNSLDVEALDGSVVRLRIELTANDIGEIYGADDFHVEPTHESIKFLAGDVLLGEFKHDSDVQQE